MPRIMMYMEWDGTTKEQYERVRKAVNWEGSKPKGGVLHIAAFNEKGLRVTDVWESAEDFQRFVEARLMPAVKQVGIPGEPRVHIHPLHELFTPGL